MFSTAIDGGIKGSFLPSIFFEDEMEQRRAKDGRIGGRIEECRIKRRRAQDMAAAVDKKKE